jgi:glycosyltransferase involved in cell wall biosynthesis
MKASVIIPVYNEERVVGECLDSLKNQTLKDFEIILIDDGSTDKTKDILTSYSTTSHNIKVFSQAHNGPAQARNLGASHASSSILVFVDADMTFNKFFLKNLIAPISAKKEKGTFPSREEVSNWNNIWARCWNINQNKGKVTHKDKKQDPIFRAILKSEFEKAGGFSKGGYTDDYSLSKKLGYKAQVAKNTILYHKNPSSPKEVFYQAKWAAKRKYKLGIIGSLAALLRFSLPFTKLSGVYKSIKHKTPRFFIFKLIYNTAATLGIFEYYLLKKGEK